MIKTKLIRRALWFIFRQIRKALFFLELRDGVVYVERGVRLNAPLSCDGDGSVYISRNVGIGYELAAKQGNGLVRLHARGKSAVIRIGPETKFSNNVQLFAEKGITMGARCLVGDAVMIIDSDFHDLSPESRHAGAGVAEPVVIEDNVFIGSRVIILKGVTIGRDSVIGAGSVVTRSIPPRTVAAGNPAKVLRPL